jgi:hypothetical protein
MLGVGRPIGVRPQPVRGRIMHSTPAGRAGDGPGPDRLIGLDGESGAAQAARQLAGTQRNDGATAGMNDLDPNRREARFVPGAAPGDEPLRQLLGLDLQPVLLTTRQA